MILPRFVIPVLATGILLGLAPSILLSQDRDQGGLAVPANRATEQPRGKLLARRTPLVQLVDRVKGAVVNIHSERLVQGQTPQDLLALAPSQNRINGMGTGIIIDPRGYIVTNHHVVEDVNFIRVKLADGTSCTAQVVARSHEQDLALLKIEVNQKLPVMPLGTAQDLMVGETVVAIGNAYGYEHTVSSGIVSALKRDVTLNKEISYKSLIQTDACINPGNSGGPLLNVNGELVGINVAIRAGAQGIGFAIPVDTMVRVVSDMLKLRYRQQTCDGLFVRDVLDSSPEGLQRTVVIERVEPGSPAELANLQKGDAIVRLGDVTVLCSYDVDRALLDRNPGDRVAAVIRRQGQETKTELVLQPADRSKTTFAELAWKKLGIGGSPVNREIVARADPRLHGGLEITQLSPTGAAAQAGIKKGDILVGLGYGTNGTKQWETLTLDNVAYVLNNTDPSVTLPLGFWIIQGRDLKHGEFKRLD
jgi:serine protease Do